MKDFLPLTIRYRQGKIQFPEFLMLPWTMTETRHCLWERENVLCFRSHNLKFVNSIALNSRKNLILALCIYNFCVNSLCPLLLWALYFLPLNNHVHVSSTQWLTLSPELTFSPEPQWLFLQLLSMRQLRCKNFAS